VTRPAPSAAHRLPDVLSVGACQSLVDCPYQFYARHLLGLRRRQLAADVPDKRDLGTALHAMLQRLHRDVDDDRLRAMTDRELTQTLEGIARDVFGRNLPERPALIAYRRRVLDLIPGYVEWLRTRARAGWRLQSAETPFLVPLAIGPARTIELSGRIDRIDIRPEGGEADLEVIDYKARTHDAVRDSAADPGEDVQLPLYALATGSPPARASYLSFERAGSQDRRARPVRQFSAAEPFERWVRFVEQRLCNDLARISGGAGLAALGEHPVCGRCEMRGLCRRAQWAPE
jgi:ATP-dependent helicase/nuclease subunit B